MPLLLGPLTALLLLGSGAAPAQAASTGPALTVPAARLAASLTCSGDLAEAGKTPVLLVPGTTLTPQVNFSWNYEWSSPRRAGPGVRSPCRTTR